ncbi:MAG TPA: TetR/AcrR family transcriptional regulator [Solirubrobacteraceae bacterium]|nr:TetR/AcrR family transcriptional regulator [Solirubrobacteraceae bacterium]
MPDATTDHRRATAQRNVAAILDAAVSLLERGNGASISAVAEHAGVSRVTVYAHFPTREALLTAVLERAVKHASTALKAAEPHAGPAVEALERLIAVAWRELDRNRAIAQATADHLVSADVLRTHDAAIQPIRELIKRGQADGAFRTDLPTDWLVTSFFALLHACGDQVRADRITPERAPEILTITIRDLFIAPHH